MRITGKTILVHDLFDGTGLQKLEMLLPGVHFVPTTKRALVDCRTIRPIILIVVVPGYFPSLEVLHHHLMTGDISAPLLYLSARTWIGTVDSSWGLFWPQEKFVVPLKNLNGLVLAEKIHDCIAAHHPNR